jgi:hypothetical protein
VIASYLELPELGRVPRTRTVYHDSPLSIFAAIAMIDAGVIPADLRAAARPQDLLCNGLARWLASRMSGARSFDLGLEYEEEEGSVRLALAAPYAEKRTRYSPARRKHLTFHNIGTRCRRAEEMITGLGQTALGILAEVSTIALPIWLPQSVEEQAKHAHGHRKADLKGIPEWARRPHRILDAATLASLANPKRTMHTGRLARAIVGLRDVLSTHHAKVRLPNRKLGRLCALGLSWEKASFSSLTRHVYDNWLWRGARVRGTPGAWYASAQIADTSPGLAEGIAEFFAGIEPIFQILAATQKVVDELVEKDSASIAAQKVADGMEPGDDD